MIWSPGYVLSGDRYTIESVFGHTRLRVTYLAKTRNGERVVLKVPNDEQVSAKDFEDMQTRFVDESFKLQRCQHHHIAKVFAPFRSGDFWCMPMEYVAGTTLEKRDRPCLSEAEAITYVTQIGEALSVLHGQDLIHRGVNPSNVMLRVRDGVSEAVLIDFGFVRSFKRESSPSWTQVTQAMGGLGMHIGYKAPELDGNNGILGPECDLYALGALLYELVTGSAPPDAVQRRIMQQQGRLSFPGDVSERVRLAIESAMELDIRDRPNTVSEWLEILKSGSKPGDEKPVETKSVDWKMILKVMGGITALITAISGLVAAFQPKDAPPAKTEQKP